MLLLTQKGPHSWTGIRLMLYTNHQLNLLRKHPEVFRSDLGGAFHEATVDFQIKKDVQPKFHKARTVPFVLREKIEKELDRLVSEDVIQPSTWAAPVVYKLSPLFYTADYFHTSQMIYEVQTL